ncbi:MAG: type IV pilus biogenesis protein PilM [Syntrophomonadaceae bacterium]|nr:type IV pilus assembly protein PilM [Bacillota bacterium]NLM88860.1 type IV pilus assembly protein PilM [Syntrophomonadaceae bacterium]HQA50379.1 type IV pilus assembly protein PilM [Syntrophomonadaceae bacterium]HQD91049.1 type IV pilus assembly protein PilM [Syntrophomonadaceae bacterium]
MFTSKTSTGLDIGSQLIKLVQVQRRGDRTQIKTLGQMPTPRGLVENGFIINPDLIGQELGKLVNRLKLRGATTVSAVSGQQVYTRLLTLPAMKLRDMRNAALYQAISLLPISIEDITTDVYPVRYFEDEEGKRCELFFVAARKAQTENLMETCRVAGLRLKRVEIEPLALHTLYQQQLSGDKAQGVLNIGWNCSYLAVFQKGILVFVRYIGFGCTTLYQYRNESDQGIMGLGEIHCQDFQQASFMVNFVNELNRSLEYFRLQSKGETLKGIVLCGGGARVGGIAEYLSRAIGVPIIAGNLSSCVQLTDNITAKDKEALMHEYPVALGLAMRGWI